MKFDDAKEKLKKYLIARIPLIIFNTVEKERLLKMIKHINSEGQSSIYIHSMSSGMIDLNTGNKVSDEKTLMGILTYIANDLQDKKNATYLLNDVSGVNEDSILTRFLCDVVQTAEKKSSTIILVSDQSIWPNLRRLGMEIELAFPNEDEIYSLLHTYIDNYRSIRREIDSLEYDDKIDYLNSINSDSTVSFLDDCISYGISFFTMSIYHF